MDPIDLAGGYFHATQQNAKKSKETKKTKEAKFNKLLSKANEEQNPIVEQDVIYDSLQDILDEVHLAGEELKKNLGESQVHTYRRAVKGFLKYVVKKSLKAEEHLSGFNIMKRKKFTLIKIIDAKLEKLAAGILGNQRDQFALLSQIDEINGLLIDLTH